MNGDDVERHTAIVSSTARQLTYFLPEDTIKKRFKDKVLAGSKLTYYGKRALCFIEHEQSTHLAPQMLLL